MCGDSVIYRLGRYVERHPAKWYTLSWLQVVIGDRKRACKRKLTTYGMKPRIAARQDEGRSTGTSAYRADALGWVGLQEALLQERVVGERIAAIC